MLNYAVSEKKEEIQMPDFSHMGPGKGLPPINNFRPASSVPDPKPIPNPLQELEKSRGPDYVNNEAPGA